MKNYPYQNLELRDIADETWKDIPGLSGFFMISDHGRIKRLEYEMHYKDGRTCTKPAQIIKPQVSRYFNKYKNEYGKYLVSRVKLAGKKYHISVARLAYHCFVKAFNMDDPGVVIFYKDGDSFHIIPSNLRLATLHEKQRRIFLKKRSGSFFTAIPVRQPDCCVETIN